MSETENLINTSKLLIYYIRMYLETLLWLNNIFADTREWDLHANAILEVHLLYSRNLIEFITHDCIRDKDRFAHSFFIDEDRKYFPINSKSLRKYKSKIDKQLAHITLDMHPEFMKKSDQNFEINQIAKELKPHLIEFFEKVPKDRIHDNICETALELLKRSPDFDPSRNFHPST